MSSFSNKAKVLACNAGFGQKSFFIANLPQKFNVVDLHLGNSFKIQAVVSNTFQIQNLILDVK